MKKYYYSLVVFAFILFNVNGQNDFWTKINKETKDWAKKNLSKCENISIKKSDSELECFKKLIKMNASFFNKASSEKLKFFLNNAEIAIKIHPGSVILGAFYASHLMLDDSNDVDKSMKALIPLLQEADNVPYVYSSMSYIFYVLRKNYYNSSPQDGIDKISRLVDCYKQPRKAYQKIILLEKYWLSKKYLGKDKKLNKKILDARKFVANKKISTILVIWKSFVKTLYQIDRGAIEREIYAGLNKNIEKK